MGLAVQTVCGWSSGCVRSSLLGWMCPELPGCWATCNAQCCYWCWCCCLQVALNWCMCKGTLPIPGAKDLAQAQENLGALGWRLSSGEVEELDRAVGKCTKQALQNIFQTA